MKESNINFERIRKLVSLTEVNKANLPDYNEPIIFFDGICNLCNHSVDFVLRHEKGDHLKFASLQSNFAIQLLNGLDLPESLDSIIFLVNGKNYFESDAVIEISKHLKFPYNMIKYANWIPKKLRDLVYRFTAKYRYKIFGKRPMCRVPSKELSDRFFN